MSNCKITGSVESFHVDVTIITNNEREIRVPESTTLIITVSGDLSKHLDLEKPITITQED